MAGADSLSRREVDYILRIFELSVRGRVRHSTLAKALGLAKSTVSLTVKKLASKGFVTASRKGVRLTDKGRRVVEEALWRHGVIEAALVKLGVDVEDACSTAAEIQFSVPYSVVERIWATLGRPRSCPHGRRFPVLRSGEVKKYRVCRAEGSHQGSSTPQAQALCSAKSREAA